MSAAYTALTKGSMSRSNTSRPNRRRAKAAMLSSLSSRRGGMKYSSPARSFPNGLRIGVRANGHKRVGAIIRKPSGNLCNRPRRIT